MADIFTVTHDTWRIEDEGVRFYLLSGTKMSALIDSGMNTFDAKQIAQSLVSGQIILINTHADRDHIAGNGAFESAYMSPNEEDNYRDNGGKDKIIPIKEGDIIDLGDRPLKVIDIPGHTPGSIALIDVKHRVLISGDSIQDGNIFMFGKYRNLPLYVKSLNHLKEFEPEFDVIYPMHGTFPVEPSLTDDLIGGANCILSGKKRGKPVDMFGNSVMLYKFPYAGFLCDIKK